MDLAGGTIAVIGRLGAAPRWRVAGELARRGGKLSYRLVQAQGLVVGWGACARLSALHAALGEAERRGLWCVSEGRLLRTLGLAEPPAPLVQPLSAADLARHSGLDPAVIRLLALFDLVDEQEGVHAFRDLVVGRQVQRLMAEGAALADIIGAALMTRRRGQEGNLLAHARLALLEDGVLVRAVGDYVAELDGQLRLPLDDGGNPGIDLLYEAAAAAEEEERWREAAALYRRLMAITPRDAVAPFNLANALAAEGDAAAAERCLERAVALDPAFAEAWYNLAHLREGSGDAAGARHCLERAVAADPRFPDALYNLARLCLAAGEPLLAAPLYERYLALDRVSPWAERAMRSLRLCRLLQGAAGEPRD